MYIPKLNSVQSRADTNLKMLHKPCNCRFHCPRFHKRLMHSAEVVISQLKSIQGAKIKLLLTESIPSKPCLALYGLGLGNDVERLKYKTSEHVAEATGLPGYLAHLIVTIERGEIDGDTSQTA